MDFLDFTNMQNEKKYLDKRGVYILQVEGYKWSNEIEGYNKTPFIRFICNDQASNKEVSFTFWLPKPGDSSKVLEIKKKIMGDYMKNLGLDTNSLKGKALLEAAIGKSCKVALREKERVIISKKTGRPMVVTDLDYYYSGTLDKPLNTNESKMIVHLKAEAKSQFEKDLAEWKKNNEQSMTDTSSSAMQPDNSFDSFSTPSTNDNPFGDIGNTEEDDDFPF